jgi:hypothetical protein
VPVSTAVGSTLYVVPAAPLHRTACGYLQIADFGLSKDKSLDHAQQTVMMVRAFPEAPSGSQALPSLAPAFVRCSDDGCVLCRRAAARRFGWPLRSSAASASTRRSTSSPTPCACSRCVCHTSPTSPTPPDAPPTPFLQRLLSNAVAALTTACARA